MTPPDIDRGQPGPRGVTFSSAQIEVHGPEGIEKIVTVLQNAHDGRNGLSKGQARRRRMWRKLSMRLSPRYWVHLLNKALPVIHPDASGRMCWDYVITLLVLFTVVMVPYQIRYSSPAAGVLDSVGYGIEAVFFMDILLNFRTAYMDSTASLVRDGSQIASHYLRTWFAVDFFSTFPFDNLLLSFTKGLDTTQVTALSLLRTLRLLRLVRLLRILDRVKGANVIRILKLLFLMATMAHWLSCAWRLLSKVAADNNDWTFDSLGPNSTDITQYLHGYLHTLYVMIGNDVYPGNDIERLYCTCVLVVGACFYAIVVGNMSLLVNNLNPTASRHQFKKDLINNTIRYLGVPADLIQRINNHYDYLSQYNHPSSDGMAFVSQLPKSMAQDINNWCFRELIVKVPLFENCEEAFISHLVMRLKLAVYLSGETIFNIGDVGHDIYFIHKGFVAVKNSNQELLGVLSKGGYFGELALLATARRTANCVSISQCDLLMLSSNDLVVAMRDFPESAAKVREMAEMRLHELHAAGNAADEQDQPAPAHLHKLNPEAAQELDRLPEEPDIEQVVNEDPHGSQSQQPAANVDANGVLETQLAAQDINQVRGSFNQMPTATASPPELSSGPSPPPPRVRLSEVPLVSRPSHGRSQTLTMQKSMTLRYSQKRESLSSLKSIQPQKSRLIGAGPLVLSSPAEIDARIQTLSLSYNSSQDWVNGNLELLDQLSASAMQMHERLDALGSKFTTLHQKLGDMDTAPTHHNPLSPRNDMTLSAWADAYA